MLLYLKFSKFLNCRYTKYFITFKSNLDYKYNNIIIIIILITFKVIIFLIKRKKNE